MDEPEGKRHCPRITGTFDELKEKVRQCGAEGEWSEIANGYTLWRLPFVALIAS